MSATQYKFILTAGLIVAATSAGYLCRRAGYVREQAAERLMTLVAVVGYSSVGLLSVWVTPLSGSDLWLPVLGAAQVLLLTAGGIAAGRALSRDRGEVGVFAVAASIGNTGFTMGGFVCYILWGVEALGKTSILGVMWMPMIVLVTYPVARHFASAPSGKSLGRLMRESLLDYRSIGLPMVIAGVALAAGGVPQPAWIDRFRLMDVLMWATGAVAYFSIGLRLHFAGAWPLRKFVAALAGMRFGAGAATGLALAAATLATPWRMSQLSWNVFLVEACVPTAITAVAVANMFALRPRQASMLFVTNTALYLAIVLPIAAAIFG